jgi:hypothetical protein
MFNLSILTSFRKFIDSNDINFPSTGWEATVYSGEIRYTIEDFEKIDKIADDYEWLYEKDDFLKSK